MIVGTLADSDATARLGALLARTAPLPAVVHLQGDLGAGKSTLARAWLRALGVCGPIRSPTYTLVERYPLAAGSEAWHLDLYRLGGVAELDYLGLDEAAAVLWLVEWPERGADALLRADLHVQLDIAPSGRRFALSSGTENGRDWLARVHKMGQLSDIAGNVG